jgi:hypothetical protein
MHTTMKVMYTPLFAALLFLFQSRRKATSALTLQQASFQKVQVTREYKWNLSTLASLVKHETVAWPRTDPWANSASKCRECCCTSANHNPTTDAWTPCWRAFCSLNRSELLLGDVIGMLRSGGVFTARCNAASFDSCSKLRGFVDRDRDAEVDVALYCVLQSSWLLVITRP